MKHYLLLCSMLLLGFAALAKEPGDSTAEVAAYLAKVDSVEKTLHYQTGKVKLENGEILMDIPSSFKFLGATDAKRVVEDLWGNPPSGTSVLGLLLPADEYAILSSYAYVVTYEGMGYVKDGEAADMDYDALLKQLKEGNVEENKERARLGLDQLHLVGWAARPYYDKDKKVLHWAKEYSIEGSEDNTLNYDIRVLGRKGVLIMQAVSTMGSLDSVNAHMDDVLAIGSFTEGNRYSDFDSGTDNVAAWTVGTLVAGKLAAKVGLFAVLAKFAKFIFLGIALAGGAIWRFITGRKKKEEEYVYEPAPAPSNDQTPIPPAV